jgi:transposase
MITPTQIYCIIEPVDMRRGADSLSQWIQVNVQKTPCDGTAYALCNRSRTRLKLIIWDGNGVWCCQRRLHRGSFVWPSHADKAWVIDATQWNWLVQGVDWQRMTAPAPAHWRV